MMIHVLLFKVLPCSVTISPKIILLFQQQKITFLNIKNKWSAWFHCGHWLKNDMMTGQGNLTSTGDYVQISWQKSCIVYNLIFL